MLVPIVRISNENKTIKTFWLEPSAPYRYSAGQFTEVFLPHNNTDNRGNTRKFTLSSSPTEKHLCITTRFDPDRLSSFKRTLLALKPGDFINITEAMGDFVLPIKRDLPVLFVAGGIGITPVRSIVKWLIDRKVNRQVEILYLPGSSNEPIFMDILNSSAFSVQTISSNKLADQQQVHPRKITDLILKQPIISEKTLIYLSGSDKMTDPLYQGLLAKGIQRHRLVTDSFIGYPGWGLFS